MRIVLVSYMGFDGPGVMHAHYFANCLADLGHEVLFLLNGKSRTAELMSEAPRYRVEEVSFRNGVLAPRVRRKVERFDPEIVHLWTPRHLPVRAGLEAWEASGARLLIHYEDDEELILQHFGGNRRFGSDDLELYHFFRAGTPDPQRLRRLADETDLDFLAETVRNPASWNWIHPMISPLAEKLADAFTSISEPYEEHLRSVSSQPVHRLYPGVDMERFQPRDKPSDLVESLALSDRTVLVYSGAIAKIHDFTAILEGLPEVVEDHPELVILQIGRNHIPKETARLVSEGGIETNVRFVEQVPHHRMQDYLALGDAYIGHVRADRFNDHRLPSKIPEYMAMGRPMLIVDHGFGRQLSESEVVKVQSDEPAEIARGIKALLARSHEWPEMGAKARRTAAGLFDWRRNTEALVEFYEQILALPARSEREGLVFKDLGFTPVESTPRRRPGKTRVTIFTDGRVGAEMSGTGIRYFEIARVLSGHFEVALGHGYEDAVPSEPFEVFTWDPHNPAAAIERVRDADVVIVHGFVLEKLPELRTVPGRLVVDLYCPFVFENLELHRDRGLSLEQRDGIHSNDLRVLNDQLAVGDHFLCSTDRQRDWILGMLTALGRIRPESDPSVPSDFVSLVPFGLSSEPPADEPASVIKGVWPGVGPNDLVLLWGGGIWSWLDPLTVIRAMAVVARTRPDVKLVFLSTRTAEAIIDMPLQEETLKLADDLGLTGNSVIFNDRSYIDYSNRGAYFADADIGVCAHDSSLETHFAFRTRVLDYLSHGLPVITSRDEYFGDYVEEHRLGRAVDIGDADAWAEAILEMVDNLEETRACRARVLEHRELFTWQRAVAPLISYCKGDHRITPTRLTSSTPRGPEAGMGSAEHISTLEATAARLTQRNESLEKEKREMLQIIRTMGVQINLIKKIPFVGRIWHMIKRHRYPHLEGDRD